MSATLGEIVERIRADVEVFRRYGQDEIAAVLKSFASAIVASPEWSLVEWLSEAEAMKISGRPQRYFREHRQRLEHRRMARQTPTGWEYRACALPDRRARGGPEDTASLADRLLADHRASRPREKPS